MAISEERLFYNFANKPVLRGWFVCFFTGRAQWQTAFCLRWLPAGTFARQIAHKLTRMVCRVSDSKSAEHKKSSSEATWIFCMEPICFGIIKGEQPLIRASRASKVVGAFLVLFWHAKENVPGGNAFCKSHRTCPTRKRSVREANHQKPFCWL